MSFSPALLGQSPTSLDLLASLLGPEQPLATGYAAKAQQQGKEDDYTPGPKLDKELLLETAEGLLATHSMRIAQAKIYAQFRDCSNPGTFDDDQDLLEQGIMETFPLLGAREEFEFRVGWMASHDAYPHLLSRDLIDADEALTVEDAVLYDFQCEARQYARRHAGTDIGIARAHHLYGYGALVGIDILDPDDTASGLEMDLLDPLTVFPVWGGPHGLLECYRVYEDTNEAIIGTFGGKPGTREYRRIEEKVKKTATKTKRGRRQTMDREQRRTVTQVWTYDEMVVILDEEVELLRVQHGYRRVPITICLGAFDQPVGVSIGTEYEDMEPRQYPTNWGQVTVSGASMDVARQWRPFAWRQMWAHQIAEAVAGRQLFTIKSALDPFMIYQFDPATDGANKVAEKPRPLPGEWVRVPLPNTLNVLTPVIDPIAMAGLAANLQSNATGGGALTQARLGAVPPQTSGSALTKLQMMGGSGDIGPVRTMTTFLRARAEWRLELRRVFGDSIGDPLGVVRVPARRGSPSPIHALTPELLDRSGTDIDIDLWQFTTDAGAAQYVTTLRTPSPVTNKPVISDETARRVLKVAPDVEREVARIDREALHAQPPVAMQLQINALQRDLDEAQAAEDHESAADLMVQIAELTHLHDMAIMKGEAAPPGGGPPGAGMGQPTPPAIGGGGPPTPALPGTSLPEQGIGVGQEGGRPFGTGGPPQPLTQPTPIGGGGPA